MNYEKSIVDESNNFDIGKMPRDFVLFKHMLDTAWKHNNDISIDEKNLLETLRKYLSISTHELHVIEAKSGRFPQLENTTHTMEEISEVRRVLQAKGLLMTVKNSDGELCDMIPDDIARQMRKFYNVEIRFYGYEKLLDYVVKKTNKQYLIDILNKASANGVLTRIEASSNNTVNELRSIVLKSILPSNLIGGFSPRDGMNVDMISSWCADLGLPLSGDKAQLIERVLDYYDSLRKIEVKSEDSRGKLISVYEQLASRDLKFLRTNGIIEKDLQCEHLFEEATNYIFEKLLLNKPLTLTGTEHPDGKLTFKDRYIMWDNKSKESPVNLKDHIYQFDRYIKSSDKEVSVFLVIAPDFTPQSVQVCVDYALNNDTQILLIKASELKAVAEMWSKKHENEIFNLGYFKQNGRFDISLLNL